MALAQLTIDINARMASIEQDMGKIAHIANRRAEEMRRAFDAVGGAIAATFAGVSVAGLTAGFRGLVDQLDALNDTADATGSSIENISALEDVAKRTGGSLDDVTGILVKFNGVLKEADGKNGVSQALKAIGLDAQELRSIDPAEALQKTATALAQFADDGNKARLVQELFGKSIREAAPFLKDLAEAGQLNAKYTTEQAAEAEKFNKQLAQMSANLNAVGRSIANEVLPSLNKLFDKASNGGVMAALGFDEEFWQKKKLAEYASELKKVAAEKKKAERAITLEPDNQEWQAKLVQANLRFEEAKRVFREAYALQQRAEVGDKWKDSWVPRWTEPKQTLPDMKGLDSNASGGSGRNQQKAVVPEIDREVEALRRKLQVAQELTEVERLLSDFESGKFKANATELGRAVGFAEQIDQIREKAKAEADASKARIEQARQEAQLKQEADRYFEASLTQQEKLEATLNRINDLYEKGAFGIKGSAEAIEKQARAIKAASDESSKLNEAARDMADIFTRAAESGDDLGKALETIIKKKLIFEPMAKSLESGFQSLFAFAGSFFNGGGSSPAPTAGSGLKLTSSASASFYPGHADGLDYVPYDNYVARLHKGERVLTAQENKSYASGGGGITIINQNQIGSGVSRADVAAAMELSKQATMAEILESRRNRGVFA